MGTCLLIFIWVCPARYSGKNSTRPIVPLDKSLALSVVNNSLIDGIEIYFFLSQESRFLLLLQALNIFLRTKLNQILPAGGTNTGAGMGAGTGTELEVVSGRESRRGEPSDGRS